MIEEVNLNPSNEHAIHCVYKKKRVLNNRSRNYDPANHVFK